MRQSSNKRLERIAFPVPEGGRWRQAGEGREATVGATVGIDGR
jgi:hypothetical protein